jgi:hypothetical protein
MRVAIVRRFPLSLALMTLPGFVIAASATMPLARFPREGEAQQHCPDDLIVWADADLSLSESAVVRLD